MSVTLVENLLDLDTTVSLTRQFMSFDPIPVPIRPDAVLLRVKDPTGVETFPDVIETSGLVFRSEVVGNLEGQWRYRWETDDPIFAYEGSFLIRNSAYGARGVAPSSSDDWGAGNWARFNWPDYEPPLLWGIGPWGPAPWG